MLAHALSSPVAVMHSGSWRGQLVFACVGKGGHMVLVQRSTFAAAPTSCYSAVGLQWRSKRSHKTSRAVEISRFHSLACSCDSEVPTCKGLQKKGGQNMQGRHACGRLRVQVAGSGRVTAIGRCVWVADCRQPVCLCVSF